MDMADVWLAVALLVAAVLSWMFVGSHRRRRRGLPPGPAMELPILGHLHLLGALPHRSLHKLSQKYGPILYLCLGSKPVVVLSSPSLARLFLHDHDEAFAFRPTMEFGKLVFHDQGSALMQPDDPRWKAIRRFYVQEFLSVKSVLSHQHVRREATRIMLQEIRGKADSGEIVEIRSIAHKWILSSVTSSLFSHKMSENEYQEFQSVFTALSELFGRPLIGDFVPYLSWLDPGGLKKKVIQQAERMDTLLQSILDERLLLRRTDKACPEDVLTALLDRFGVPQNQSESGLIKAALLELLLGSTDNTTAAVEWVMAELLCAPKSKLAKLQQEIDSAVQSGQQVEELHLDNLPYLQAVVKEALRLHPPAPLLLPHFARDPIKIAGFSLPQNTRLFVNVWAIGRDESSWEAAYEFEPERFLKDGHASAVSFFGSQSKQLLMPFSHGRRGCPGSHFALTMVGLLISNLVHGFDWQPSVSIMPEEEVLGISNMLAKPFTAKPIVR